MTTIRQIIIDAYREGGLVQIGLTPEADELDEGFRKLQTLIQSLIGNEMGAPLTSLSYGRHGVTNAYGIEEDLSPEIDSYFVPSDTRLMVNIDGPKTVYLEPNPDDGSRVAVIDNAHNFSSTGLTINANGRRIEGSTSVTLNEDGVVREWFYRSDLGEWQRVNALTLNSQNPFPPEFDDFLITLLAMRINPRYQAQTAPETLEELQRTRRQFRARYKQITEMRSEEAIVRLPSRHRSTWEDVALTMNRFNRGLPN